MLTNDLQVLMDDPSLTMTLGTIPHHKLWCVRVADKQGRTVGMASSEDPRDAMELACLQAKNDPHRIRERREQAMARQK